MDWIINHLSAYWNVMIGEMIIGAIVLGIAFLIFIIYFILSWVI